MSANLTLTDLFAGAGGSSTPKAFDDPQPSHNPTGSSPHMAGPPHVYAGSTRQE